MKTDKIISEYPNTVIQLKEFFLDKLVESFNEFDDDVDFKRFMVESGITDDQITNVLEGNPRSCFDMFDKHNLILSVVYEKKGFTFFFNDDSTTKKSYFDTRLECEKAALETAIDLLEQLLTSEQEEVEQDDNENK
jgi:hypothetical protein|tara:strand:- start:3790 stop:4197 length:408 start_codon:yes stop_codon:yes gene_type:complete